MTTPLYWNARQIGDFLIREFPQSQKTGRKYEISTLAEDEIVLRVITSEDDLRPGGTISGPTLMEIVDVGAYMLLLAHHGEYAALSVTTNLQISFLRKAEKGPLRVVIRFLKHGRTLSVIDASIHDDKTNKLLAHAETSYFMAEAWKSHE